MTPEETGKGCPWFCVGQGLEIGGMLRGNGERGNQSWGGIMKMSRTHTQIGGKQSKADNTHTPTQQEIECWRPHGLRKCFVSYFNW